ncbi:cupin domain-containing protein [Emticicia sp. BO119]|uniref:cupin domain-containing protein n=1 Tax=Emticicia sp. BO119 TaxID=2757768 RepID=UPI0015EFE843|nr:cupin domain-containing protein [Emticicia sp. BO119]MBA4853333.1 cupin domain-containing protein [Emticicia sp. BO119]
MTGSLRKIYNPIQKDYVTFLKTATETNGEYTLVEVELAPKGGVGVHYHKMYSEKFDCLTGELKVQLGSKVHTLSGGMSAMAFPNIHHRFFNSSDEICKFRVEIRPGSSGFEQSLQIAYGLARDGETKKNGFPKSKYILAWLFEISESNLPGWMSIFEWILRRQAKRVLKDGIDKQLIERYVEF